MPDETMPENPDLERSLESGGFPKDSKTKGKRTPTYEVIGDTKIPVSKAHGMLWKSRKNQAISKRKKSNIEPAWDEAIRYYKNDHSGRGNEPDADVGMQRRLGRELTETENLVFANVTAMVPALYAKNPSVEVTATKNENEEGARVAEKLVNTLIERRSSPGLNLKQKARRGVAMCTLANLAYIEIGYTIKDSSSEQALEDLQELSAQLEKAKTTKIIQEIEGKLEAVEEKIDLLRPSGPWSKFHKPHDIVVDSDSDEEDLSDANWIMIHDYVSTSYIKAVYGRMSKKGKHEVESIYKPSHVLKVEPGHNKDAHDNIDVYDNIDSFSPVIDGTGHSEHGFEDREAYKRAQRTEVYYVWDKITRRVLLFNAKDWTWPIWVWDDPYKLDRFFPVYPLSFYIDPEGGISKGEVTYYLDQQDGINLINTEKRAALSWARRNILYNKSAIDKDEVEAFLRGDDDTAVGVNLPDGMKMADVVFSMVPPSVRFMEIFDKEDKINAINRVSSVQDVMRGTEFKTNTTNDAVETYNSAQQTRVDEKIDAIEDWVGLIAWGVLQMCLQFMSKDEVENLIGDDAGSWVNMSPNEIRRMYNFRLVGGSSQKPTSVAKKKEAMNASQILGQFAKASPVALLVALKMFERAFDEVVIEAEDWASVRKAIERQIAGPQSGGQQRQQGQQGQEELSPADEAAVRQELEQLPPQAQQAVQAAVEQGVPVVEAIKGVKEQMRNQPTQ